MLGHARPEAEARFPKTAIMERVSTLQPITGPAQTRQIGARANRPTLGLAIRDACYSWHRATTTTEARTCDVPV